MRLALAHDPLGKTLVNENYRNLPYNGLNVVLNEKEKAEFKEMDYSFPASVGADESIVCTTTGFSRQLAIAEALGPYLPPAPSPYPG
jgi:hypothetical protein